MAVCTQYLVQIGVARKYQNSDRWCLSAQQSQLAVHDSKYLQGWGELPDTTIFPTLGHWRMGHTRDVSEVDAMSNAASTWPLEKTTQSPNTKSLSWWLCSCHENEQVRSVQNTNQQTNPSKIWGDISQVFFPPPSKMCEGRMPWLMLLFRRAAVYVRLCMSVLRPGGAGHEQGACAMKGLGSGTISQGYLRPTCKEKIPILFTCTCTNIH